MKKRYAAVGIALLAVLMTGPAAALRAEEDPLACVKEIERVCATLEDHLETCLAERGARLSESCRGVLKMAMAYNVQENSGPAACVPDVQRLCPDLRSTALGDCITDKQKQFSEACQKYLQAAGQKREK